MIETEVILAAERLTKDVAAQEALRIVEEKFVQSWKRALNVSEREHAWAMVRAVDELREQISLLASSAKVSEFNRRSRR